MTIVLAGALFYYSDLGQYLSFKSLKTNRDQLHAFYQTNKLLVISGFITTYIVTVALSFPGATILTLAAGAIFGPWMGTLAVNIGATLGATLAFLIARFLLRDWVEEKFGEKLKAFNGGLSSSAINYILFLRLIPLFPFFLVNLASGLTKINLRTYFCGTLFGTLPGTFIYANAGSNIASINSVSDITSPQILGALALLGLFALLPTFYKKFWSRNKTRSSST
tara:strand:- start:693 stop:1361 length:669 start_codon:yes stop_codon:yes gene_type:complete